MEDIFTLSKRLWEDSDEINFYRGFFWTIYTYKYPDMIDREDITEHYLLLFMYEPSMLFSPHNMKLFQVLTIHGDEGEYDHTAIDFIDDVWNKGEDEKRLHLFPKSDDLRQYLKVFLLSAVSPFSQDLFMKKARENETLLTPEDFNIVNQESFYYSDSYADKRENRK